MENVVSVILPAYRAHGTIVRAIRSLLDQSWTAWEAIVVTDDLTDYYPTLLDAEITDGRIRYAGTGRIGAGAAAARNAGLEAATGTLVAALDADDRFAPDRLAALVPLALEHGAAVDNVAVVRDEDDTPLSILFPPEDRVDRLDLDGFLATSVPMFPVVRRALTPGWEDDVSFCDDVVFNVRLLDRVGTMPVVRRPLYEYRQRRGSITASADSGERADAAYRHVLARLAADGLGIADAERRGRIAAAFEAKRDLNAAYMAAQAAGLCTNFQEFLALDRGAG